MHGYRDGIDVQMVALAPDKSVLVPTFPVTALIRSWRSATLD